MLLGYIGALHRCAAQWLQARGRQRRSRPAAREAVADPGGVREGDALPLPTLNEIQAGRTPTLRHVPGVRACPDPSLCNDERSWRELLHAAAPTCLRSKKHAKATPRRLRGCCGRCGRFLEQLAPASWREGRLVLRLPVPWLGPAWWRWPNLRAE